MLSMLSPSSSLRQSSAAAKAKKNAWPSTVSKKLGEKLQLMAAAHFMPFGLWICPVSERRDVPHPCKYSDAGLQVVCSLASISRILSNFYLINIS